MKEGPCSKEGGARKEAKRGQVGRKDAKKVFPQMFEEMTGWQEGRTGRIRVAGDRPRMPRKATMDERTP